MTGPRHTASDRFRRLALADMAAATGFPAAPPLHRLPPQRSRRAQLFTSLVEPDTGRHRG
ncbi:hypothetical protein CJD44_13805 [Streptomyces sp. alain-838]|nr:hypothetical protein CJD44_13805 [Streptomyces sp. alain-838]